MTKRLSRLLRPRSIALFGGVWAQNAAAQCLKAGYQGDIWPVRPDGAPMAGLSSHQSVEALPGAPDAAFIAVNRHASIEIVRALAARGAGGAVCFASGFAESGDAALQAALIEAAGEMPILGPNCYGLINFLDGALLWPDQHGGERAQSGVGMVAQSSNILLNMTMQRRGLPLAYAIAAGNQAQTGAPDIARALLEDPRVTALGLHIEGARDIPAWEALADRARALGKPVAALVMGRSAAARAAMMSHTASLAGDYDASRAFLRRLGFACAHSLPQWLETLMLLHAHGPLEGRDIASLSCSGGEAALMADSITGRNLRFRPLESAQAKAVEDTANPLVSAANPFDYHTFDWGNEAALARTFSAFLGAGFDLGALVLDYPRSDRCEAPGWDEAARAMASAARQSGVKAAVIASLPESLDEARSKALLAQGLAPLHGVDDALFAMEAAADIHEALSRPQAAPLAAAPEAAGRMLDEFDAKALLKTAGVCVPEGARAQTPQEAAAAAQNLGFPVALKGLGAAHKSEAGFVALHLENTQSVEEFANSMPGAQGFLVERMAAPGVEMILGVAPAPPYGLGLTLGAGGVLSELLQDCATSLLPATEADIREALKGLRIHRLLQGWRGQPPCDIRAVIDAAMALQKLALEQALYEIEINPLIVTPQGAAAADALIITGASHEP